MGIAIQKKLIQWVLQPLASFMSRFPEKVRDGLFVCAGLMVIIQNFLRVTGVISYRYLIEYALGCFFLGIMILCAMPEKIRLVRFRAFPALCWFGAGLFMFLAGVRIEMDHLLEATMLLAAFPVTFIAWGGADHGKIFRLLSKITLFSFIVYTLVNMALYPMEKARYAGLMGNVNGAAVYLTVVILCLLLDLLHTQRRGGAYFLRLALLGLAAAQLYYTSSRTGYLACGLTAVTVLCFYLALHRKEVLRYFYTTLLYSCLSVLVCVNVSLYLFQLPATVERLTAPPPSAASTEQPVQQPAEQPVQQPAEQPAGEEAPAEPPQAAQAPKPAVNLNDISKTADERLSTDGRTLDQISTGRISIWKKFFQELNWTGHTTGTAFYFPELYAEYSNPHNTVLQIGFESGIPAGVCYLLYNLFSGLAAIWYAVRYQDREYSLFPLAAVLSFGVISNLGALATTFSYLTTFYYYLTQFSLITVWDGVPESGESPSSKRALYVVHGDLERVSSAPAVRQGAMYRALQERGWNVFLVSGFIGRGEGLQRQREIDRAIAWMREGRPDFCYIESSTYPIMYHCDYALIRLLRREGIPTAYFYRDFYRWFPKLFPRRQGLVNSLKEAYLDILQWRTDRVLQNVDIVYFPDKSTARYFPYRHMKALPPAGQLTTVSPDSAFPPDGPATAIYVGAVSAIYGSPMLMEAFSILNKDGVRYPLILVCREGEFEKAFPNYSIPAWLEIHHASGKELEAFYARASLGLLTLQPNEYTQMAVGTKLFQYISYGLPVLSTDTAAMKSLIEENAFGRTAPYDVQAFAAAAKALLDDAEALRRFRQSALKSLTEKHLWVHRVDQIAADLLGKGG